MDHVRFLNSDCPKFDSTAPGNTNTMISLLVIDNGSEFTPEIASSLAAASVPFVSRAAADPGAQTLAETKSLIKVFSMGRIYKIYADRQLIMRRVNFRKKSKIKIEKT